MHNKEEEELSLLFDRVVRLTGILDDKLLYIKNPLKKIKSRALNRCLV